MASLSSLEVNPSARRASRGLLALAVTAGLVAGEAHAGGAGSEYVFLGGGAGALRPARSSAIRLVSEDLSITLRGASRPDRAAAEDFGYSVRSRLRLSNRGRPQAALYAVPVVVPAVPDALAGPDTARAAHTAEAVASTIRITVAGAEHRCSLRRERPLPPGTAPADVPAIGSAAGEVATELAGLCVASLVLPAGSPEVTVTWSAPLFGVEETAPVPPDCAGGGRRGPECRGAPARRGFFAYYPFGAAAPWAGQPDRVSVTVDLGGFTLDRPASTGVPEDAGLANGVLHWTWNVPALEGRDVSVVVTAPGAESTALRNSSALRTSEAPLCRLEPEDVRASSSSAAPDAGAAKAVDGAGATAWCVTRRRGVGEWIELRFEPPAGPDHVTPYGLYLLPGLAASQGLYEGHGRVTRIRYGPCGRGAKRVTVDLPVRDGVFEAMVKVPGSERMLAALVRGAGKGEVCLRVEIAAVLPAGKSGDACISELSLPMRCR